MSLVGNGNKHKQNLNIGVTNSINQSNQQKARMSEAQKNKGLQDESLNDVDSSIDDFDIENNIYEDSSPRLKKNQQSIQQIGITDAQDNHSPNQMQRSLEVSEVKYRVQSETEENLKSELKIIQNKLDQIKAKYSIDGMKNKNSNQHDKYVKEYQSQLKEALLKLNQLIKLQDKREGNQQQLLKAVPIFNKLLGKKDEGEQNQSQLKKVVQKSNEPKGSQDENQSQWKKAVLKFNELVGLPKKIQEENSKNDQVEIKFAQNLNKKSINKSQKNQSQEVNKSQESPSKQSIQSVENQNQAKTKKNSSVVKSEDDEEREYENLKEQEDQREQDEIWKGIMQRTLKKRKIVQENTMTNLSLEELRNLQPANLSELENPKSFDDTLEIKDAESFYESFKKYGVMFELHQFGNYIHLAQIISFKSNTDKLHLIQKYTLDLDDTVFRPSGCFVIQTHINQIFNQLSIMMREQATHFFKLEKEYNRFQMYKHIEKGKNGQGNIIEEVFWINDIGFYSQLDFQPDQEFKVEFMIDLSDSKKVNKKQNDFQASLYISITQLYIYKDEPQQTEDNNIVQDNPDKIEDINQLSNSNTQAQLDNAIVETQPDKIKGKDKPNKVGIQLKLYKYKQVNSYFDLQELKIYQKVGVDLKGKTKKNDKSEIAIEEKTKIEKDLIFEENLDNVGFFSNQNQKTKFFLYFKNKHQIFLEYNEKEDEINNQFHESSVQGTDSQFFECHFKRWQAQSFVVKTEKIKKNDQEIEVEFIYFLFLNSKNNIIEVQKEGDDAKQQLADQQICQFYLCNTKDSKKLKKTSEDFLKNQIEKRKKAQNIICKRVKKLEKKNYFLLDSQKVIVFSEDTIDMLYLEDFSVVKSSHKDNEQNLNSVFLYQTRADKKSPAYSHFGTEDYRNPQRHGLFLHKTRKRVIYGLHQIFVNCNEKVQNVEPTLEISKEWMFIDLYNKELDISIIYLGDQKDKKDNFLFQYHVSKSPEFVTFFYYVNNEIKFTQSSIDAVKQSLVDQNNEGKQKPLELKEGQFPPFDVEINIIQAENENDDINPSQKTKDSKVNVEAPKKEKKQEFNVNEIQFEQVTDLARTENHHIKFIAYLSKVGIERQGLGTPYFCRAQINYFSNEVFYSDKKISLKNLKIADFMKVPQLVYKEIPLDFDFYNKESAERNLELTLLFASCSSYKKNVDNSVEQSFQIGFTHYDNDSKNFLDCVDIYEYQVKFNTQIPRETLKIQGCQKLLKSCTKNTQSTSIQQNLKFNTHSIDFKIQKSYLVVLHEKIHKDFNDGSGKVVQRKALVPIIDDSGEPQENQILFLGKKEKEKSENNYEENQFGNKSERDQDNSIDDESSESYEGEKEFQSDDDWQKGGEKAQFEGGIIDEKQENFLVPLDQDNCNKYSTKITTASYKHFGLKSRAQFSVLATNIQSHYLQNGSFSESEKLYLLNQEMKNLLSMSEPTFSELFGEINQETSDFICETFQPKFIKKGSNNFAINLQSKKFDQSSFNKIFKQLKDYLKLKDFIPSNSIINRASKCYHLAEIFDINILFDLQAGFNHQSLIELAYHHKKNAVLVELVRLIQRNNFHNLNRKNILMADLPQLMSDQKVSIKDFLNRNMTPLFEEDEENVVNIAHLLEDTQLPTISDKKREYFEIISVDCDDEKTEIIDKVVPKLNKKDLDEAEEVNFIYIDFFMTTLKLKIDRIKGREKADCTDYLKFFDNVDIKNVNCNEIFIAGLICQREDEEIYNHNIIQKIIERQQNKFSLFGNKVLWFFYMLGFYVPYVTTILLRYTYANDFYGQPEKNEHWITYGNQEEFKQSKLKAIESIYVFRAICMFTQIFYFCFELEELSFSGYSYFQQASNFADFTNPFIFFIHVILSSISIERDDKRLNVIDCLNSYVEFAIIIFSSVKFLNLAKSFNDYQMLVEMLFTVIRQIIPLLFIYLFTIGVIAISQMAAMSEYKLDYDKPADNVNGNVTGQFIGNLIGNFSGNFVSNKSDDADVNYDGYPEEYPLIPNVGFLFLQTLRNSVGDFKTPQPGLWKGNKNLNNSQYFALFLQWVIYLLAIFLINIIVLNFLIIWVGEIYSTVKGGIPYYFRMQAEMNFNYLKSTRHLIKSQNKYNQIWVIKSPIQGLPDNVQTDKLEDLEKKITQMQQKMKDKLQKQLEENKKDMDRINDRFDRYLTAHGY